MKRGWRREEEGGRTGDGERGTQLSLDHSQEQVLKEWQLRQKGREKLDQV